MKSIALKAYLLAMILSTLLFCWGSKYNKSFKQLRSEHPTYIIGQPCFVEQWTIAADNRSHKITYKKCIQKIPVYWDERFGSYGYIDANHVFQCVSEQEIAQWLREYPNNIERLR